MAPEADAGERARVGYLGPEGTFSEEALLTSAEVDLVEPVPLAGIYETVTALREGAVDWAVVPIENSLDGSVTVTLDLLAGEASDVRIVGEAILRVHHALIAAAPTELAEIRTVHTHPKVPGQCLRFLRGELAGAQVVPAASTAEAVRMVVSRAQPGEAAIATPLAAEIYGGIVLRAGVEDREDNETRFVWLARAERAGVPAPLREAAGGPWRTSLVFSGPGAEAAGWLVRCLDEFARRAINLTRIESRPRRGRLGTYVFFAELEGRESDALVAEAIAGLSGLCAEVRVLGSYRAAGG